MLACGGGGNPGAILELPGAILQGLVGSLATGVVTAVPTLWTLMLAVTICALLVYVCMPPKPASSAGSDAGFAEAEPRARHLGQRIHFR